jgi:hypothetical protein
MPEQQWSIDYIRPYLDAIQLTSGLTAKVRAFTCEIVTHKRLSAYETQSTRSANTMSYLGSSLKETLMVLSNRVGDISEQRKRIGESKACCAVLAASASLKLPIFGMPYF